MVDWVGVMRKTGYARTRAEAEDKLNRALVLSADGLLSDSDPTFAEWSELWVNSLRGIKDKTIRQYEYNLMRVSQYFGAVKLSKVSPMHLENMYTELLDSGLSPSTVHQMHVNVGTCLKAAYRKGTMNRDIAALTNAPPAQKRKPIILSRAQWKSLLSESATDPKGLSVEFTLKSGMRIDVEALSTTWANVDFELHQVTVGASKTVAGEG